MLYFLNCVNKWCRHTCRSCGKQYTKCDSVSSDGKTCYNPQIRDGSAVDIVGRPVKETKHSDTQQSEGLLQWCKQLFPYAKKGMAVYSSDPSLNSGKGGVYWTLDNRDPHSGVCSPKMWCLYDGRWQQGLVISGFKEEINCQRSNNLHGCVMTSVTCE